MWNELEILKNMPINTNVIRAFGFEYEASHVFVAMELCERSLADEIFIQDGIGPLALCRLIESLKDGFKCLVENNIVHGDLKPDNILVVNNVYKLADFGLSSFAKINERVKLATGTFPYAHPDVFKSTYWEKIGLEKQPNATFPRQIDLYSMGVTIFEAITGKLPFNASNTQSMYKLIAEKPKTAVRGTEVHGGFYYYDEMAKCTLRPFQKFKMTQLLVKLLQVLFKHFTISCTVFS